MSCWKTSPHLHLILLGRFHIKALLVSLALFNTFLGSIANFSTQMWGTLICEEIHINKSLLPSVSLPVAKHS